MSQAHRGPGIARFTRTPLIPSSVVRAFTLPKPSCEPFAASLPRAPIRAALATDHELGLIVQRRVWRGTIHTRPPIRSLCEPNLSALPNSEAEPPFQVRPTPQRLAGGPPRAPHDRRSASLAEPEPPKRGQLLRAGQARRQGCAACGAHRMPERWPPPHDPGSMPEPRCPRHPRNRPDDPEPAFPPRRVGTMSPTHSPRAPAAESRRLIVARLPL